MNTVKVTYIGRSGRRRARGKKESYWFRHQTTLDIPASDVEAVTGSDPESWQVDEQPVEQDAIRSRWPAEPKQSRRRGRKRRGSTKTKADAPIGDTANEE